jgi:hypothetical protein
VSPNDFIFNKENVLRKTGLLVANPIRYGRVVAQAVSRWLPTAAAQVRVRAENVGFEVVKVALGQVFSEYFGFLWPIIIPPISPSS